MVITALLSSITMAGRAEFLAEGDDVVEILGEGKYGAGFSLGGGGCDQIHANARRATTIPG